MPMVNMAARRVKIVRSGPGGSFGFSIGEGDDSSRHVVSRVAKEVKHLLRSGDKLISINGEYVATLDHDDLIARIVACNTFVELQVVGGESKVRRRSQLMAAAVAQASKEAADRLPEVTENPEDASRIGQIAQTTAKRWQVRAQVKNATSVKLRKHSHILDVGEQVRMADEAAFDKRQERAVKEAVHHEQMKANDKLQLALKKAEEKAEFQKQRALEMQRDAHDNSTKALILQRDEQERAAVQAARDEERTQKQLELQQARREADAREAEAMRQAIEKTTEEQLELARVRQEDAVNEALKELREELISNKRAALEELRCKYNEKMAEQKRIHESKLARVVEQQEEEMRAVEDLEEQLAQSAVEIKKHEARYLELQETHQRTLAVTLSNYDEKTPWL